MNELFKIEARSGIETVNARDLHAAMEVTTRFNDWIARRIESYGFIEGKDFYSEVSKTPEGGRPSVEYFLSVSMAKELATVENNEKGRAVRRYLIAVEERWRAERQVTAPEPLTGPYLIAKALLEADRMIKEKDARIAVLEPKAAICEAIGDSVSLKTLSMVGKITGIGPRDIFDVLSSTGVIFKRHPGSPWEPYERYIRLGYFRMVDEPYEVKGTKYSAPQMKVTGAGEVWITRTFATRTESV